MTTAAEKKSAKQAEKQVIDPSGSSTAAEKTAKQTRVNKATEQTDLAVDQGTAIVTVKGVRVTTHKNGFCRAGRQWHGTTEVALSELSKQQLTQLRKESRMIVQDIELAV